MTALRALYESFIPGVSRPGESRADQRQDKGRPTTAGRGAGGIADGVGGQSLVQSRVVRAWLAVRGNGVGQPPRWKSLHRIGENI